MSCNAYKSAAKRMEMDRVASWLSHIGSICIMSAHLKSPAERINGKEMGSYIAWTSHRPLLAYRASERASVANSESVKASL